MTLRQSFEILDLSSGSSLEEINKAFKVLAKKYHPDANPGNEKWATEKMSLVNQAYQTILESKKGNGSGTTIESFLKDLIKDFKFDFAKDMYSGDKAHRAAEDAKKSNQDSERQRKEEYERILEREREKERLEKEKNARYHSDYEGFKNEYDKRQAIIGKYSALFKTHKDLIDEGMFIYYQFKLYNKSLRQEGTGRFKFGDAKRYISKGLNLINGLYNKCPLADLKEEIKLYLDFVNIFLETINSKENIVSYNDMNNVNAFRHYRDASDKLNEAFSHIFFKSKSVQNVFPRVNSSNLLMLSNQAFLRIIEKYPDTDYIKDAKLKSGLITLFYALYKKNFFS
jgi:curved DNA-binding protein CbpA